MIHQRVSGFCYVPLKNMDYFCKPEVNFAELKLQTFSPLPSGADAIFSVLLALAWHHMHTVFMSQPEIGTVYAQNLDYSISVSVLSRFSLSDLWDNIKWSRI